MNMHGELGTISPWFVFTIAALVLAIPLLVDLTAAIRNVVRRRK